MATAKDEIMARSGPEDRLYARPALKNTSAELTAGPDWNVLVDVSTPVSSLHYKDEDEMRRLHAIVGSDGPAGKILRDTASSRYICAKQSYVYSVSDHILNLNAHVPTATAHTHLQSCINARYTHQRKACTPADLEYQKCGVKLARAVDTLCRKPFWDFAACLEKSKDDVSKCLKERTTYDMCVEDF